LPVWSNFNKTCKSVVAKLRVKFTVVYGEEFAAHDDVMTGNAAHDDVMWDNRWPVDTRSLSPLDVTT
jgi:hypothetical protein